MSAPAAAAPDAADAAQPRRSDARHRVTVAHGDGIGPEIMAAVLRVLEAADAPLDLEPVTIGLNAYQVGHTSGISPEAWEVIRRNPTFLKAPITTPQGGGYRSLNVTIRTTLGLYANVRPTTAYSPYVQSMHPGMDLVIVRENEEDLYAGIEFQPTAEVTKSIKLITRPGTERIVRFAFEYARAHGRRTVACMTKDNIMKHTDGLFHRVFDEIAADYPDIQAEHHIIDIGAARLAAQPERFDVIVTLNLYGDILSDIAGQVAGSVGISGSANIGPRHAMFEAVHGSAPDIAGRGVANPSGLLNAAVQMLVHLGEAPVAERIANAWLATLESGLHTADLHREGLSEREVTTDEFTDAIIARLGAAPARLRPAAFETHLVSVPEQPRRAVVRERVGIDVYVCWDEADRAPGVLAERLRAAVASSPLRLTLITNRGVEVHPGGFPEGLVTDHWRCRFLAPEDATPVALEGALAVPQLIAATGIEVVGSDVLQRVDGRDGFSSGASA
jgi:isocitrate dehydrogenase